MNLRELLSKQKFAKNAKILPLLDKKNTSDLDLAKAALTTRHIVTGKQIGRAHV